MKKNNRKQELEKRKKETYKKIYLSKTYLTIVKFMPAIIASMALFVIGNTNSSALVQAIEMTLLVAFINLVFLSGILYIKFARLVKEEKDYIEQKTNKYYKEIEKIIEEEIQDLETGENKE